MSGPIPKVPYLLLLNNQRYTYQLGVQIWEKKKKKKKIYVTYGPRTYDGRFLVGRRSSSVSAAALVQLRIDEPEAEYEEAAKGKDAVGDLHAVRNLERAAISLDLQEQEDE